MTALLLEVLDHLAAQDILGTGCACGILRQSTASSFLWFRAYCKRYRGHLSPPPSFQELAAGAAAELELERFAWKELLCSRARLMPSTPAEECLASGAMKREMAPPERAGMVDAEHDDRSARSIFSTVSGLVWQKPLEPLPLARPIAYAEVYVHGGASIGLVSGPRYGAGKHIGWDEGSMGYHGDDGSLFCGSGFGGRRFGPSFGLDPELVVANDRTHAPRKADVIGVGIEFGAAGNAEAKDRGASGGRTVFFTKNGALVGSVKGAHRDMSYLAFALHRFGDSASVNVGTCRFLFDIEAYSQMPPPPAGPLEARVARLAHDFSSEMPSEDESEGTSAILSEED